MSKAAPAPEEATPPLTLAQKIVNVMAAVGYVQKRGRNAFHNYNYATEADVAAEVRMAFIAERVILLPSMKSISTREQGKGTITQVVMSYRLIDADTGETFEYDMPGEGADMSDKGVYKAITGSEKYALMKPLMIPTGDDPEKDNGEEKPVETLTGAEVKALETLLERGDDGLRTKFLSWIGQKTVSDIPRGDFQRCVKALEKKEKAA